MLLFGGIIRASVDGLVFMDKEGGINPAFLVKPLDGSFVLCYIFL
jgi:hypothetical protein